MGEQLYEFSGMPGVKRKRIKGPIVDSVSAFLLALRKHRLCSAAGDHGSVTVYVDDDGAFRCTFQRWHSTIDEQTYATKAQVKAWLVKWLPKRKQQP